jgi:hypothetical protein
LVLSEIPTKGRRRVRDLLGRRGCVGGNESMIKLLIGGSPCTYWSIAQKNNRETEASGIGWELFKNYLIAKEKFKPDYFLYENNVSAAKAIKDQIKEELRVWDGTMFMDDSGSRYIEINSALVSARTDNAFMCIIAVKFNCLLIGTFFFRIF